MLQKICLVLVFVLFPFGLAAQQFQDSTFKQYSLKYGISIQIPEHWKIIEKSVMDQINTNTEDVKGTPQGNNEILIAANFYSSAIDLSRADATVRLSIRHKRTIDQNQLLEMTERDMQLETLEGKASLEKGLKNANSSKLITEFLTTKKWIKSFVSFETVYTLNNNEKNILYIIPLGDRLIKLHLSYNLSEEYYAHN